MPAKPLYQKQTELAVDTFGVPQSMLPSEIIEALLVIKKVLAQTNASLAHEGQNLLSKDKSEAILKAVDQLLENRDSWEIHFPLSAIQTGSGTNSNMNVNEVIATLASKTSGLDIHPNNDVNLGQSSNDTFPSSLHLASLKLTLEKLIPSSEELIKLIEARATEFKDIVKTGRTHSMDAMPVSFELEFLAWAQSLKDTLEHLRKVLDSVAQIPLGGTAVGTGINAHPEMAEKAVKKFTQTFGYPIQSAKSFSSRMGSQHTLLILMNAVSELSTVQNKIAQDLILSNSGPLCGFSDIQLPKHLEGSSIMPGKVNPVLPEAVSQIYAQVMGLRQTVEIGAGNSRHQLNVYLPIIGQSLIQALYLVSQANQYLEADIKNLQVNESRIKENLSRNPILVTALNRRIGYEAGKEIVNIALKENRPLKEVALEKTDLSEDELDQLLDPKKLAQGGIQ